MAKKNKHITEYLHGIHNFENYDGFLFIGDPHLSSYKPGKRLDSNFLDTIIDKLDQAADICIKRNLFMIILGDLFHDDKDHNPLMLTKLIKVFKKLPHPPLTIIGNHEKTQDKLTDDTFTAVLREANLLYTIEKNQYWGRFKINTDYIYIGGTPYGAEIPDNVTSLINKAYTETLSYTIWLTHHDLAIGASYPGCVQPKPIIGCDIVVNGHDHSTKEPKQVGNTLYFNPGNITRLSTDKHDHVPRVWLWTPKQKMILEPIPLRYQENIFNLAGKQVIVPDTSPTRNEVKEKDSKFIKLLEEEQKKVSENSTIDQQLTNDATIIQEQISLLAKTFNTPNDIELELIELAKECSKEIREQK